MSNKEKVVVTIDSNEASQNPELTETIVLHEDVEDYVIEPLDEGDLRIKNCLFERKSPSDFAQSLQDGRLRKQVERMSGRRLQTFVLVEGDMEDFNNLSHTNIPSKSLRGMTASIIARNRIPVVFCSNARLLADMAVRIARKTEEEPTTIKNSPADTVKELSFLENLFMGIDGIGMETAENLAGEFTSIQSVCEASEEDFASVKGVGRKRAKTIHESVHVSSKETSKEKDVEEDAVEVISV